MAVEIALWRALYSLFVSASMWVFHDDLGRSLWQQLIPQLKKPLLLHPDLSKRADQNVK
jgi:hypothetical protein